ncbi:MAG: ATP-binding cassette domain-containing protein [Fimbriimonadaceae bacterium]|nr:ATP-binding cassette domain-containing protein [Fimbriimonadaceae bacterium]
MGGNIVLDTIDQVFVPGHVTALIGPNGSGKSTLLNIIAGTLPVTYGRVMFNDEDVTHLEASKRAKYGVARTFQGSRVLNSSSVLENVLIAFYARSQDFSTGFLSGSRWSEEEYVRAIRALTQVGLSSVSEQQAGELSFGQKRVLNFTCALALNPRLLILDEPFAGLDRTASTVVASIIKVLAQDGATIIVAEHDGYILSNLADRFLALDKGRCKIDGFWSQIPIELEPRKRFS